MRAESRRDIQKLPARQPTISGCRPPRSGRAWRRRGRFGHAARALLLACCPLLACATQPAAGLQGVPLNLSDYRGKVVLLHFWATWCRPCLRELPSLVRFHDGPYRRLANQGLVLLTVSNDLRPRDLQVYLADNPLPFPVFFDSLGTLNEDLHLRGVPHSVVIGRGGEVLGRLPGKQDWESAALLSRMRAYVGGADRMSIE